MKIGSKLSEKLSLKTEHPIWTKSFTILTVGSIVSVMASSTLNFCMSLLVLDLSESVFLYSLYLALTQAIRVLMPLFSGPFVDRHSRRKMIFTLDFCSGGIFFIIWFLFKGVTFKTWIILVSTVLLTAADSTYLVAYQSLYPMLVHRDNLQKAYSITAMLETLSGIMVPVATVLYKYVGIAYVLLVGAILYWIAAVFEIFIEVDETEIITEKHVDIKQYLKDLKEGILLLKEEKGLCLIAFYMFFLQFSFGVRDVVWLPYFRGAVENGYLWYMITTGAAMSGVFMSGFLLYILRIPNKKRYAITIVLIIISFIAVGSVFMLPLLLGVVAAYIFGLTSETSYTFRTLAIQSFLDDKRRGRYTGISYMMANVGQLCGQLFAGTASATVKLETLNIVSALVIALGLLICFIIWGPKYVKPLYNFERTPLGKTECEVTTE